MTKREVAIQNAKIAGYHGDKRWFTRLIIESRVNRQIMNDAWTVGTKLKTAGVPCACYECKSK